MLYDPPENTAFLASGRQTAVEEKHPGAFRLLWPLLRPYRWALAGGVLAMALSAGTMLGIGWGLKNIVDHGLADGSGVVLNQALLVLLVVIMVMAGASFTRLNLVYRVAERVTADLRKQVYVHLLGLDPAFFDTAKTGDQIARINADTTVLQLVITSNLPSTFRHALMLLGGVIMLFMVSPAMTGMALAAVPALVFPAIYFGRRVRAKSRDTQNRIGDITAYGHETVQGMQTIQSFGYEGVAAAQFARLADGAYETALRYIRVRAALTAFVIAVVFGAIGLLLWAGGHKVLAGDMTGGELSAFIFYVGIVAGAVTAISEALSDLNRASGAADRIAQLLHARSSLKADGGAPALPVAANGDIAFENVGFSYPSRPESRALEGVSFGVQAGECIAIVGPSGAGKSTVFHLLQRFFDPAEGRITIDGCDISAYDPRSVRKSFAVVAQDPMIFSLSVADNIRLGRPEASLEEVYAAAREAQADDFIRALPQGYDTLVGERGNRLSGGQRQRLAIARALLKNPRILLLDEATAALDAANELAVHQALRRLMQGRTTVIIAHRLSTVREADRIIVLDQGRVVAQGSHEALYGHNSLYTHLAGLQLAA